MFKNVLIALLGVSLVLMGLAYLQSERGRNYLVEQLRQATGLAGPTGTATPPPTTALSALLQKGIEGLTATPPPTTAPAPPNNTSQPPAGQAPGAPASGNATATAEPPKPLDEAAIRAEVGKYAALFKSRVVRFWSIPSGSTPDLMCLLKIELQPDGKVQNVSINQSSGDEAFDRSAVAAVKKAAPFPLPDNPEAATKFKSFKFSFKSNPGG